MIRTESKKAEVLRLIRRTPFQPFMICMENGDRVTVHRREQVAFDPREKRRNRTKHFYVISNDSLFHGSFEEIDRIIRIVREEPA